MTPNPTPTEGVEDFDSARELAPNTSAATPKSAAIDLSKIRAGDVLLVRCVAAHGFSHQRPMVTPQGGGFVGSDFMPPSGAIVSHTPKAIAVGDRVCIPPNRATGTVLAMAGDKAWVDWNGRTNPATVIAKYLVAEEPGGSGSTSVAAQVSQPIREDL